MQPARQLQQWLQQRADKKRYLFHTSDLRALWPTQSEQAFRTLLSRAAAGGLVERICQGIYLFPDAAPHDGRLLFHVAALLRTNDFNYISLETALSDTGVISQIPLGRITLMSSGRSNVIDCGEYGDIEFIHTNQQPNTINQHLTYDTDCRLWRADTTQAIRDMRNTHRDCDLIDWELADALIR